MGVSCPLPPHNNGKSTNTFDYFNMSLIVTPMVILMSLTVLGVLRVLSAYYSSKNISSSTRPFDKTMTVLSILVMATYISDAAILAKLVMVNEWSTCLFHEYTVFECLSFLCWLACSFLCLVECGIHSNLNWIHYVTWYSLFVNNTTLVFQWYTEIKSGNGTSHTDITSSIQFLGVAFFFRYSIQGLMAIASFINLYKQLSPWKYQNLEEEMAIDTPLLNASTVTYGTPESSGNNATTVTRKSKSTVIRRTDSNESETNGPPSFISFLEDVKQFSGYAWPHEKSIVKSKIIICAVLIFISTLISLSIPIQVGLGVDALNQGQQAFPWKLILAISILHMVHSKPSSIQYLIHQQWEPVRAYTSNVLSKLVDGLPTSLNEVRNHDDISIHFAMKHGATAVLELFRQIMFQIFPSVLKIVIITMFFFQSYLSALGIISVASVVVYLYAVSIRTEFEFERQKAMDNPSNTSSRRSAIPIYMLYALQGSIAGTMFFVGAFLLTYKINKGILTPGNFAAFSIYSIQLYETVYTLVNSYEQAHDHLSKMRHMVMVVEDTEYITSIENRRAVFNNDRSLTKPAVPQKKSKKGKERAEPRTVDVKNKNREENSNVKQPSTSRNSSLLSSTENENKATQAEKSTPKKPLDKKGTGKERVHDNSRGNSSIKSDQQSKNNNSLESMGDTVSKGLPTLDNNNSVPQGAVSNSETNKQKDEDSISIVSTITTVLSHDNYDDDKIAHTTSNNSDTSYDNNAENLMTESDTETIESSIHNLFNHIDTTVIDKAGKILVDAKKECNETKENAVPISKKDKNKDKITTITFSRNVDHDKNTEDLDIYATVKSKMEEKDSIQKSNRDCSVDELPKLQKESDKENPSPVLKKDKNINPLIKNCDKERNDSYYQYDKSKQRIDLPTNKLGKRNNQPPQREIETMVLSPSSPTFIKDQKKDDIDPNSKSTLIYSTIDLYINEDDDALDIEDLSSSSNTTGEKTLSCKSLKTNDPLVLDNNKVAKTENETHKKNELRDTTLETISLQISQPNPDNQKQFFSKDNNFYFNDCQTRNDYSKSDTYKQKLKHFVKKNNKNELILKDTTTCASSLQGSGIFVTLSKNSKNNRKGFLVDTLHLISQHEITSSASLADTPVNGSSKRGIIIKEVKTPVSITTAIKTNIMKDRDSNESPPSTSKKGLTKMDNNKMNSSASLTDKHSNEPHQKKDNSVAADVSSDKVIDTPPNNVMLANDNTEQKKSVASLSVGGTMEAPSFSVEKKSTINGRTKISPEEEYVKPNLPQMENTLEHGDINVEVADNKKQKIKESFESHLKVKEENIKTTDDSKLKTVQKSDLQLGKVADTTHVSPASGIAHTPLMDNTTVKERDSGEAQQLTTTDANEEKDTLSKKTTKSSSNDYFPDNRKKSVEFTTATAVDKAVNNTCSNGKKSGITIEIEEPIDTLETEKTTTNALIVGEIVLESPPPSLRLRKTENSHHHHHQNSVSPNENKVENELDITQQESLDNALAKHPTNKSQKKFESGRHPLSDAQTKTNTAGIISSFPAPLVGSSEEQRQIQFKRQQQPLDNKRYDKAIYCDGSRFSQFLHSFKPL